MLRKGQEGHVRAERDILKSASLVHSPCGAEWIVRLYYSFQDRDHLYLVSHQDMFSQGCRGRFNINFISQLITWYLLGARIHGWRRPSQSVDRKRRL